MVLLTWYTNRDSGNEKIIGFKVNWVKKILIKTLHLDNCTDCKIHLVSYVAISMTRKEVEVLKNQLFQS